MELVHREVKFWNIYKDLSLKRYNLTRQLMGSLGEAGLDLESWGSMTINVNAIHAYENFIIAYELLT
jgi:hypothetical protein